MATTKWNGTTVKNVFDGTIASVPGRAFHEHEGVAERHPEQVHLGGSGDDRFERLDRADRASVVVLLQEPIDG